MVKGISKSTGITRSTDGTGGNQRRAFLKRVAAGSTILTTSLAGCTNPLSGGSGKIKVGSLSDRSGSLSVYGSPMTKATKLAVDQINNEGGLLGRDVKLINPDTQSNNDRFQNLAQQLILEDQVDVLLGGISSSSREAIRPIIDENKQLYFYPALYEGGVCDEYTYLTGPVPTQAVEPLVDYMVNEFGNNVYTIAADYNFGQISALWTKRFVEQKGGTILGEEFIPLSVSDFGSSINKIQKQNPDWIMTLLVGANHAPFFKQADSSGLQKPMGSSVQVGASYEHKSLSPPVLENMHASFNYFEELKSKRNRKFVKNFRDKFPNTTYINQHAQSQYISLKFYQKAVEEAETIDQKEVASQLESGPSLNAPEGNVQLDGATHHTNHDIHILRVADDHSLTEVSTAENVQPSWLQKRCSLDSKSTWEEPTTKSFSPKQ